MLLWQLIHIWIYQEWSFPLFLSHLTNQNSFGWTPCDVQLPGWIEGLLLVENEIVIAAGHAVNPTGGCGKLSLGSGLCVYL